MSFVRVAWVLVSGVAVQAGVVADLQTIELPPFHGPNVIRWTGYGNCQWLYSLNEPNETLFSEPNYGSEKRVYYAACYGDARDNVCTITPIIDLGPFGSKAVDAVIHVKEGRYVPSTN